MLELKDIIKVYKTGEVTVEALKGITLSFRDAEFVSILGASGCGKTTMLNIIGGLDRYTSGDLIIDGKSTKNFSDKDWDTYRNHKIGFVFQGYNLIHHLNVLENVEMALTISGVKKNKRKQMSIDALKKVGLEKQIYKMPSQLSGGQMQRVAIARALVNDPKIILADEPTGALDTETSIQVMNLLKEISKDKLIIMVTHNPKIAKTYSTRIIKLSDGKVDGDTMPFEEKLIDNIENSAANCKKSEEKMNNTCNFKREKGTSMNFLTALFLSLRNMFHKAGRTFLTSFAGSIGIIGVALVLAISNGFSLYINNMQSETLAGYPISISTATIDYKSFDSVEKEDESLNENDSGKITIYDTSLQKYIKYGHYNCLSGELMQRVKKLEAEDKELGENAELNLVQYNYYVPLKIIVPMDDGSYQLTQNTNTISFMSGEAKGIFYESLGDESFMMQQYDTLYTTESYDPDDIFGLTLVVNKGNKLSSYILNGLGIIPQKNENGNYVKISFNDICNKEYKLIYNNNYYIYDEENDKFNTIDESSQSVLSSLYSDCNSQGLKINRILVQKENSDIALLQEGVMYSTRLTQTYLENCSKSEICTKQLELKKRQQDAGKSAYTFYAPYKLEISEFSNILPPDGFESTQSIIYFLDSQFGINLSIDDAFELAMQQIGNSSIPQNIVFYPKNFEAKKKINKMINEYNKEVDASKQIIVSDQSDILTSTLGNIVNIVSYVLIAFSSISLIVSSIMIGIITYVSVIERTKEIGILRSLGARKRDISRVFNAEAISIGFMAGVIGIIISYLMCPIINEIIGKGITGIGRIAILSPVSALILICVSMGLTFISGCIPSAIASRRDPVECLRTE